jgi:hypothetical protein
MKDFILKRQINDKKNNIRTASIPYGALADVSESERQIVVFLGDNFKDLPGTNLNEANRISNLCLDYVRKNCSGYQLYYKPHPKLKEEDESRFLNLTGFEIVGNTVAELYFLKNIKKIKYVFAVSSMGSVMAYNMGLNSYSFMNIVGKAAHDPKIYEGQKKVVIGMPSEFFIDNLSQSLKENKKKFDDNRVLEKNISDILEKNKGRVWMLLGDTAALADTIATVLLIKKYDPGRLVNLIIIKHHRWVAIPQEDIREYFDNIFYVPRISYSLRPAKIWRALGAALKIKKFDIKVEDIIIEVPGLGFAADCFASYFNKNLRVALIYKDVFNISCEEQRYSRDDFRTRPGSLFFNFILEPLLRLEPYLWLEDKRRLFNVDRYRRPMNDIFDYIWII